MTANELGKIEKENNITRDHCKETVSHTFSSVRIQVPTCITINGFTE